MLSEPLRGAFDHPMEVGDSVERRWAVTARVRSNSNGIEEHADVRIVHSGGETDHR